MTNPVIAARKAQIIEYAAERGLELKPEDITYDLSLEFDLSIDGMDPYEWVDAMTDE
jgi:hypothetical protein